MVVMGREKFEGIAVRRIGRLRNWTLAQSRGCRERRLREPVGLRLFFRGVNDERDSSADDRLGTLRLQR